MSFDERRFVNLNIQHFSEVYQRNSLIKSPQSTQRAQSSAIPVTTYEEAAASRFRTRMTRIGRIFTDIFDHHGFLFPTSDNKPQNFQGIQSRIGKPCVLRVLCGVLTLFALWLARIYTYPRASASTVAPVDVAHTYGCCHTWRSVFYCPPPILICVHPRIKRSVFFPAIKKVV